MNHVEDFSNMNDHELLAELLAYQKKDSKRNRIAAFANILLIVVLLVALITIIPRALDLVNHVESSLQELDALAEQANEVIVEANGLADEAGRMMTDMDTLASDASVFIGNANKVLEENTEAVTNTVQRLNEVDFEGLNEAIENLNDAIRPLSEFARMFR